MDDPSHREELDRHRRLLDDWISKGDSGEGEEPAGELAQYANHRWGKGVNPEYEIIRQDNDGDGLSDDWERFNNRDPEDGRLLFKFDCGGWQTEGWEADGDGKKNFGAVVHLILRLRIRR